MVCVKTFIRSQGYNIQDTLKLSLHTETKHTHTQEITFSYSSNKLIHTLLTHGINKLDDEKPKSFKNREPRT